MDTIGTTLTDQYVIHVGGKILAFGPTGLSLMRDAQGFYLQAVSMLDGRRETWRVRGNPLEAWEVFSHERATAEMRGRYLAVRDGVA